MHLIECPDPRLPKTLFAPSYATVCGHTRIAARVSPSPHTRQRQWAHNIHSRSRSRKDCNQSELYTPVFRHDVSFHSCMPLLRRSRTLTLRDNVIFSTFLAALQFPDPTKTPRIRTTFQIGTSKLSRWQRLIWFGQAISWWDTHSNRAMGVEWTKDRCIWCTVTDRFAASPHAINVTWRSYYYDVTWRSHNGPYYQKTRFLSNYIMCYHIDDQ